MSFCPKWPPEPALLQCPFCDGSPVWRDRGINCLHCGAIVPHDNSGQMYERHYLAGKWNRRAPRAISPKEKSLIELSRVLREVRKSGMAMDISDALLALVEEVAKERAEGEARRARNRSAPARLHG